VVRHIMAIRSRLSSVSGGSAPVLIKNSKFKIQNYLLIEGSGGLLVPLGEGYTVRDLIRRLNCEVIIVSRNKLGTINHTLLTLQALLPADVHARHEHPRSTLRTPRVKRPSLKIALMDSASPDASCLFNREILAELVAPIPLISLQFLGRKCASVPALKKNAKKCQKTLARLLV
jgi:hypothetical protein